MSKSQKLKNKEKSKKETNNNNLSLMVIKNIKFRKLLEKTKKILNIIKHKAIDLIKGGVLLKAIKKVIFLILFFFVCYCIMEFLNGTNVSFADICLVPWEQKGEVLQQILGNFFSQEKFLYNYMIFIALYLMIYGITNRTKLSCSIICIFTTIFGILNYIVRQVRGVTLSISDIYSIRTALSVSENIKVELDGNFIAGILLFVLAMIILIKFIDRHRTKSVKNRGIIFFIGIICMISLFKSSYIKGIELWDLDLAYRGAGANATLMRMITDLKIEKPKNYKKEKVEEILKQYSDDTDNYDKSKLPNVIAITNESFFDIQDVYNIDIAEDNIPYIHKLMNQKNVVNGIMHSSCFGGGTANVEYEFLTQNSTAFLPVGSIPYQQYIKSEINQSLIKYMNNLEYNTYGIHPFNRTGYSRGRVYNLLGFNNKLFIDNMLNFTEGLNFYPSDSCTYDSWKTIMEQKNKEEKNFSYILTVQNHVPYTEVCADAVQYSEDNELNSYLQVEHTSDEELEKLIEYINNLEEDTILIFFGDHQANIEALNDCETNYPEEESKYIIPFVIYANFDIEEKHNIETSTNYLQNILFDSAKMPKDPYTKYLEELREKIPVITKNYYKDKEGNRYEYDDKESPYYDEIQKFKNVEYYEIFDN